MTWEAKVPEVEVYGKPTVCLLVLFAVFDFLVARHTKARYFTIHVLANTIIVILTFPSLVWILQDPLVALASDDFSPVATASCLCIHLYHILAFNNLIWLDWLHHGIMIGVVLPLVMTRDSFLGPILDSTLFFVCGLPGGLDYAMLAAVKHGILTPLQEKKYNCFMNTWVRSVGMILVCGFGYVQAFMKDPNASWTEVGALHEMTVFILLIWNSQYFMERVIGNYHVRCYQDEQKGQQTQANGAAHVSQVSNKSL